MPYNSRKDRALDSDKRNIEMGAKKKKPPVIPEKLAANGRKRPPKAQEKAAMSGGGGGGRGLGGGTARDPGQRFGGKLPRKGEPEVTDQMARNGRDYNIPKPTGNPGPIESPDWNPPQLSDPDAPEGRNPDGSPRGTVYNPRQKPTGPVAPPQKLKWGQTAPPEGSVAPAGQRWSLNQGKYITPPVKPQVAPPMPEGKPNFPPGQEVPVQARDLMDRRTAPNQDQMQALLSQSNNNMGSYVNPQINNALSGKAPAPNMGSDQFGGRPGGNMLPPQFGGGPGGNMLGSPGAPGQPPVGMGGPGQVNPIAFGPQGPGTPGQPTTVGAVGPQPGQPMGPGQSGAGGAAGGLRGPVNAGGLPSNNIWNDIPGTPGYQGPSPWGQGPYGPGQLRPVPPGGPSGPPFMPGYPGMPGGPGPDGNMTPPWMQPPGQPGQQINPIAFNNQPNPMSPFQTGGGSPQQNPQYWQQLMQLMQMQQGQGR